MAFYKTSLIPPIDFNVWGGKFGNLLKISNRILFSKQIIWTHKTLSSILNQGTKANVSPESRLSKIKTEQFHDLPKFSKIKFCVGSWTIQFYVQNFKEKIKQGRSTLTESSMWRRKMQMGWYLWNSMVIHFKNMFWNIYQNNGSTVAPHTISLCMVWKC